jgi:hypothetical protein
MKNTRDPAHVVARLHSDPSTTMMNSALHSPSRVRPSQSRALVNVHGCPGAPFRTGHRHATDWASGSLLHSCRDPAMEPPSPPVVLWLRWWSRGLGAVLLCAANQGGQIPPGFKGSDLRGLLRLLGAGKGWFGDKGSREDWRELRGK